MRGKPLFCLGRMAEAVPSAALSSASGPAFALSPDRDAAARGRGESVSRQGGLLSRRDQAALLSGASAARGSQSSAAREGSEFPVARCLIVAQDIRMTIVGVDLEPALARRKPAVDDGADANASLAEPEGDRFLFVAIARIAFDANRHSATILPKPAACVGVLNARRQRRF